jgi:hypothetical protein
MLGGGFGLDPVLAVPFFRAMERVSHKKPLRFKEFIKVLIITSKGQ